MFWLTLSLPSIILFEIVPKINDRQLLHPKHILPTTNKIFQGSVLSQLLLQICTCNVLKLRYVICRIAPYTLRPLRTPVSILDRWGWIKTGKSVVKSREDRRNARYNTTHFKMLVSFPFWILQSPLNPLNKNQAHNNNCIPRLRALFAWD